LIDVLFTILIRREHRVYFEY